MRPLGLDVGLKTVGVATSDELGLTTQKLETISIGGTQHSFDMEAIKKIAREYDVTGFVLSLPKNIDGSNGTGVSRNKNYGKRLEEEFPLPVVYSDERLTTIKVDHVLIEKAEIHDRKRRKEVIDQMAAVLISQNYLGLKKRNTDGSNN